jgi:hypothetical protein
MMITDKFVMLNFPKTGSSFAREAIRQVYGKKDLSLNNALQRTGFFHPRIFELMLPKINEGPFMGINDQHGKYIQIPSRSKNKPILSIIRNPFSRIVSSYYFKWWQKFPPADIETIKESFPRFPDLSFSEFYDFKILFSRDHNLRGVTPQIEMGNSSLYFIQFYSPDAVALLKKIDTSYFERKEFIQDFSHIHFIHQEHLVPELKSFLLGLGIKKSNVDRIDTIKKINENKYPQHLKNFMEMYDDKTIEKVLSYERLLFELFPVYRPKSQ